MTECPDFGETVNIPAAAARTPLFGTTDDVETFASARPKIPPRD